MLVASVFVQKCYVLLYSTEDEMCGKKSSSCFSVSTISDKNMDTLVTYFPGMEKNAESTIKPFSRHTSLTDADFSHHADNIEEVFFLSNG